MKRENKFREVYGKGMERENKFREFRYFSSLQPRKFLPTKISSLKVSLFVDSRKIILSKFLTFIRRFAKIYTREIFKKLVIRENKYSRNTIFFLARENKHTRKLVRLKYTLGSANTADPTWATKITCITLGSTQLRTIHTWVRITLGL